MVGAGPTGLALALQAAAHGARVEVVDRRDGTPRPSRALVVQPRTLEVLAPLGATGRLLEVGSSHVGAVLHARGREVRVDLGDLPLPDTAHPSLLLVSQAVVEATLLGLLDERGVAVRWGAEVDDVRAGDGDLRGRTVVRGRDGALLGAARFVVGCDGAASRVRAAAGIAFPGRAYRHPVVIADVDVAQPAGLSGAHVFAARDGILFLFPLGEQAPWRLVVAGTAAGLRAELAGLVRSMTDGAVTLGDVAWAEQVPLRHHLARAYRRGSVLLAGDAAHVHSPIGGQGLGTGVQDAVNLGWKLAQVIQGTSPDSLLDTYHAERHPVGARVLKATMAQVALHREDARTLAARDMVGELLKMEEPRKHIAGMMSGLDIRYDLGPGHPLLGRRMPDLDVDTASGPRRIFSFLHAAGPLLLDLGASLAGDVAPWSDRVQYVGATYGGRWELPVLGDVAAPAAVLVRPDGYVAWVGDGTSQGLMDALATWFGTPTLR